jgi:drug/metabolite transporter (DMT)-like permease
MSRAAALALVYCGAAFGSSFLFMRVAAPDLPAAVFAFGRVGLAALLLLAVGRGPALAAFRRDLRHYVVVGFFMSAAPFLLFAAAEHSITAGLGAIINATSPMWTLLVLAVWVRQPLTAKNLAAIALGFAGVGLIVGVEGLSISPDAWLGVLLATLAASSYGVGLTYIRRNMMGVGPMTLAFGQLAMAAIILAPFAVATAGDAHATLSAVAAVGGIALFSTAIAMPTLYRLNREVGALGASTVTFLNPIFGVLWGVLLLSETLSPTMLAGMVLVFVALGVILHVSPAAMLAAARRRVGSATAEA